MENVSSMSQARLLTFTGNLATYTADNAMRMNVPSEVMNEYREKQLIYAERYAAANNPATRTPTAIKLKDQAKKSLVAATLTFVRMHLQNNQNVTEADLSNMELSSRIPKPRGKHPAPTTKTVLEIKLREHYQVEIDFRDELIEHSKRKPVGVHCIEIRWEYAAVATVPLNPDKFTHTEVDTATPYILHLSPEDQGKQLYIASRWENTTGE
ncbi:MAG: hypothetical protein LBV39_03995, partial [Bacteroidales bacterium]|nr:hypothetical protein [Bacteroidales bacterium]